MIANPASANPRPPRSWKRWGTCLALRLTIYWIVYTLSIGPLYWRWFESNYLDGSPWVAAFYVPLLFVCENVPGYGEMVNRYVNWWIVG